MNYATVLKELILGSGMSFREVSRSLGKSGEWARNVSQEGRSPKLETVVDIADVCGYDVVIVNRDTGEEKRIEPSDGADGEWEKYGRDEMGA
jgi:transcriptional regulator with XRE-family HTH domain